jgi:putative molybdopterin biosynthesis protein
MSGIMAPHLPEYENRLREKRQALALSQKQLADLAGITRQAVSALEANQYSPATSVALQLARALRCRVEDLFSIKQGGEIIEGDLLGSIPQSSGAVRAQVTQVGHRLLVRPLVGIGELSSLSATADGLIIGTHPDTNRVKVKLLKDREAVRRKVVVGGCDPAMFLAGEHPHGQQHRSWRAEAGRSSRGWNSSGRREDRHLATARLAA